MSAILNNQWIQAILVMFLFSVIKGFFSAILGVENYPAGEVVALFKARDWARLLIIVIYDVQMMSFGVMALRAAGFIEIV